MLHGTITMFEQPFCVTFIRVQERQNPDGKIEQYCKNDILGHLDVLRKYTGTSHWATVELYGFHGNWVMLITPYGEGVEHG